MYLLRAAIIVESETSSSAREMADPLQPPASSPISTRPRPTLAAAASSTRASSFLHFPSSPLLLGPRGSTCYCFTAHACTRLRLSATGTTVQPLASCASQLCMSDVSVKKSHGRALAACPRQRCACNPQHSPPALRKGPERCPIRRVRLWASRRREPTGAAFESQQAWHTCTTGFAPFLVCIVWSLVVRETGTARLDYLLPCFAHHAPTRTPFSAGSYRPRFGLKLPPACRLSFTCPHCSQRKRMDLHMVHACVDVYVSRVCTRSFTLPGGPTPAKLAFSRREYAEDPTSLDKRKLDDAVESASRQLLLRENAWRHWRTEAIYCTGRLMKC